MNNGETEKSRGIKGVKSGGPGWGTLKGHYHVMVFWRTILARMNIILRYFLWVSITGHIWRIRRVRQSTYHIKRVRRTPLIR
jgi:hypothetical protein